MKDLLVVSETNQIVFQMMQAKQAVQQSNDNQNSTGVFGKGNVVADMCGWVLIVKQMFFIRILKIRGAIGEAGQKDKLTYVILLKQVEEKTRAFLTKCNYKGYYSKIISSKCFGNHWQLDFRQINKVSPIAFWWKKYIRPQPAADSGNPQSVS